MTWRLRDQMALERAVRELGPARARRQHVVTRGTVLAVFEWRPGDTMQFLLNTDHTLTPSEELTARRAAAAASPIE